MKHIYSKKTIQGLYETMLRIRHVEESFVEPIFSGAIRCPVHLYVGEEGVAAGTLAHTNKDDIIFGTHRSHGHYLAKGGDMKAMVAEIYGKETGCAKGRGGSMHVVDAKKGMLGAAPIVAGTVSLAVGAALSFKIKKQKNVAIAFFGDGAVGEGVLHEALNFAALNKLPVLFVCENNYYSTHMPLRDTRPYDNIFELGAPHKIAYARASGNDVLKVYDVAGDMIQKCRTGQGPAFIEFLTYRYRGHVGPNDNIQGTQTDIRPKAEVSKWKRNDPIRNLESYIARNKILSREEQDKILKRVGKEIQNAHAFSQKSRFPDPKTLSDYVFKK